MVNKITCKMIKLTLTQKILLFFAEKALVLDTALRKPSRFAYDYLNTVDDISYHAFHNTLGRLEEQGMLAEVEESGRKKLKITLKGKIKIWKFIKRKKIWDGKWRIVIFDIPEIKKKMRNFFREKLSDLGFKKLQESVWICPYDIADEVEELIDFCRANEYIHYLLVEELDNKQVLMDLFKLEKKNH